MKLITSFAVTTAFFMIINSAACAQKRSVTDQFEVSGFTAIESSAVANIHIRQSPTVGVTAEGDEELLNILEVRMDNDKLVLTMDDRHRNRNRNTNRSGKLTISISTPTLTRIDSYGVGNIEIVDDFSTPELTIKTEGVGNITADKLDAGSIHISSQGVGNTRLGGTTDKLQIKSEGVGQVNTAKLTAKSAVVTSQGVGNVSCHASEYLKVRSEGVGSVTYYGNPVKKDLSKDGLGRITARD